MHAIAKHRIRRHLSGADGIRDDGQPVAPRRAGAGEGFGRGQQVFQPRHRQHTGAAQGGLECGIGCAGRVGEMTTGTHRHHRAQARGGAGSGEEHAAVTDMADIEQDGAGAGIAGQPVEHRGEAEIGVAAHPHDMAEADAVGLRPVQHRAAEGGGLGDQRHLAGPGQQMRARGVQADAGHRDAERARPHRPHAARRCCRRDPLGHADHHTCISTARRQRREYLRRHPVAQHREVRRDRQAGDILISQHARNRADPLPHRQHGPLEAAGHQIGHHLHARLAAGADDADRGGMEQSFRTKPVEGADHGHVAMQHIPV